MKLYQLQCVRYYPEYYDARDYIFFSTEQAHRYGKIFLKLLGHNSGSAFVKEVKLNTKGANMYVIVEENHGEIGYFLDRDEVYKAARDVIMENPYLTTWNGRGYDSREVTREEITDKQIDDDDFCVCVYKYKLNKVWC